MSQGRHEGPALSVVIPAHDEGEAVIPLIDEVSAALTGHMAFEVVIVDDASTDETWTRLSAAAVGRPWLCAIRHTRRAGQSTALLTGVRQARAPLIATLDGDGQNDPADIRGLWEARWAAPIDDRPLLLAGHRTARRATTLKRVSSRIANAVRGALLRDRTPDTGCGLKLFPRETFLALPHFDHMHRFLPALFLRAGGTVRSVPVRDRARRHGRSHYGVHNRLWVGVIDLLGVLWLMRRAATTAVSEIVAPAAPPEQEGSRDGNRE
ncbi:MAG: glycosyltransferase family 2 protein [Alphaproteobacteria bacterium]|nr:glycosyltransferase family 2 protein [Alphaproteobacteria bacterium]